MWTGSSTVSNHALRAYARVFHFSVFRVCPHAWLIFNNNTWTGSSTVSNYAFRAYTDVQKKKKLYKRKREKKIKCPWQHPESNPRPLDPKAGAILTEPRCLSYIHYAILVTYNQHIGLPPHFHPNQIKNAEILLHILPLHCTTTLCGAHTPLKQLITAQEKNGGIHEIGYRIVVTDK